MILPGIIPRLKNFVQSGFGGLAYVMAVIYHSVRLLPTGHPYLNPANVGRFGIRHVIAQAANNLVLKKQNIDQIIIFAALLIGFVLLVIQFAFLAGVFIFAPAFAGVDADAGTTAGFGGLFKTMKPELDIAFMMMDSVFGIPDMFNSCIATGASCGPTSPVGSGIPTPFHSGLHELFKFYNTAILIVAVLIFLYYILIMVAETAQSGTPFGRRFNHIWAPLRLVVALGLLVPLNYGLNSAQYITLFSARMGSGFATNGWLLFNRSLEESMRESLDGSGMSMVAKPAAPQVDHIWQSMALIRTCALAYVTLGKLKDYDIDHIEPYLVKKGFPAQKAATTDWEDAVAFYDNGDVMIRFGHEHPVNDELEGNVFPWCGEIVVSTKDLGFDATKGLQANYYKWILAMWDRTDYKDYAKRANCVVKGPKTFPDCTDAIGGPPGDLPNDEWKQTRSAAEFSEVRGYINSAFTAMKTEVNSRSLSDGVLARGWGGAGLWYNEIARWNGALFSGVKTLPTFSEMPKIMKDIEKARSGHDENMNATERFEPYLGAGNPVRYSFAAEEQAAKTLSAVYIDLRKHASSRPETQSSGNVFYDLLNMVFGIDGLFDLRDNDETHPMASLVAAGKSIIDASIRNLMISLAFAVGGGATEAMELHIGGGLQAVSSMFVSFATLCLSIGFILYYVLPFLPFIYFFFAVGTWVKSVFEAMVGVPLWALAHLKIDGNGLPGDTAMNGYFLIFEIFVRPILTVFGLVASVLIFSAMATTLNGIFDLVTSNLTGFDCTPDAASLAVGTGCDIAASGFKRAIIDEFFFTVIYAILVFMIGTTSFKLIDRIPEDILRWMGAGVKTFNNIDGDPTSGLMNYVAYGGQQISGQVIGAAQEGATAVGRVGGTGVSMVSDLMTRSTPFSATGAPGPGPGPRGGTP